jgi:hypothetical protein
MREGLQSLNDKDKTTPCQDRPVPFTEVRQTPEDAAALCGKGTDDECPLIKLCEPLGFTESVYADDMVYGGYTWRRGLPVLETSPKRRRTKASAYA